MWKIYVGNLDSRIRERDLADEFRPYGNVRSVWVARNPPGYAFVELDDRRDAEDAISALDGKHGWRVEMSKKSLGGRSNSSYSESTCFKCGSSRHFARECRSRGSRHSHQRSRSPRSRTDGHRDSVTRSERDDRSPRNDRRSSHGGSPRGRGRDYDRPSGSDRSESRGSHKRRRERSLSLEDTKLDVVSSERAVEQSRSPQSDGSDSVGSQVVRKRSPSPPNHQGFSEDGSPVRNGRAHSKSPAEKDLDMDNDSCGA